MNSNLSDLFRKTCINRFPAYEYVDDEKVPRLYRREDFSRFAEDAFKKGEDYFYAEPVSANNPNGPYKLCEPKYVYELKHSLTEEEFKDFIGLPPRLKVPTEKGTIIAEVSPDMNYPGIYIDFQPKEVNIPIASVLVEYNSDKNNIETYVWGDAMNEDYTYKADLQNLDKYLNYVEQSDKNTNDIERE